MIVRLVIDHLLGGRERRIQNEIDGDLGRFHQYNAKSFFLIDRKKHAAEDKSRFIHSHYPIHETADNRLAYFQKRLASEDLGLNGKEAELIVNTIKDRTQHRKSTRYNSFILFFDELEVTNNEKSEKNRS